MNASDKAYFISGVSCTFKSAVVSLLQTMGVLTVVGDYADHCKKHPYFLGKQNEFDKEICHTMYVMSRTRVGHIHDRSFMDGVVYKAIFDVIHELKTLDEAKDTLKKIIDIVLRPMNNTAVVFVFLPADIEVLHKRMQNRASLYDDLGIEYVRIQTIMFKFVAEQANWQIRYIASFDDALAAAIELNRIRLQDSGNVNVINYTCDPEFPLRVANGYASGYDLPIRETITLEPKQFALINTGVRVSIPLGQTGTVEPRSSSFKHNILIGHGVIDCDYRGEIKIAVRNLSDTEPITFAAGTSIAQLVISNTGRKFLQIVNHLDTTERDEQGFGSSDNRYAEILQTFKENNTPMVVMATKK